MGLDQLVASLRSAEDGSSAVAAPEASDARAKRRIRAIRERVERGGYEGHVHEAFEEIGGLLTDLNDGCEFRLRGKLHALRNYATIGVLSGVESFARDDLHARNYLVEAKSTAERISKAHQNGASELFSFMAYTERAYAHASVLLDAIDSGSDRPEQGIRPHELVLDYACANGADRDTTAAAQRGLNYAKAALHWKERCGNVYDRMHELVEAIEEGNSFNSRGS